MASSVLEGRLAQSRAEEQDDAPLAGSPIGVTVQFPEEAIFVHGSMSRQLKRQRAGDDVQG